MLAGLQRHVDAGHPADLAPPHPGAVDHVLGGDRPLCRLDAGHPAVARRHPGDLDVLQDRRAALTRALGEAERDVGRVGLAVGRQEDAADHPVEVEQRVRRAALRRGQDMGLEAEAAGHRRAAAQFLEAVLRERHRQRAVLAVAGGDPGLGLERVVQLGRILGEAGHVVGGAQLADQAGSVPGGAGGEAFALQQQDVGPAELGEVVGDRAADHPTADDHHPGLPRQFRHRRSPLGSVPIKRIPSMG